MRLLLKPLVALVVMATPLALAQDFRGIPWGSSRDYVKASETLTPSYQDAKELDYQAVVAGFDVGVVYAFVPGSGELAMAGYVFHVDHTDTNLYIDDYDKVKAILAAKYGPPSVDTVDWKSDLFKGDKSSYGLAVATGAASYVSVWYVGEERISLVLKGDNYQISLIAGYTSNEYYPKLKAAQAAESQSAF